MISIIDQLKEEVLSFEYEDDLFIMGKDFMRFKFKTVDNLVYNEKNNIPVCAKSLSSIVKKRYIYYPQFKLRECFYDFPSFS